MSSSKMVMWSEKNVTWSEKNTPRAFSRVNSGERKDGFTSEVHYNQKHQIYLQVPSTLHESIPIPNATSFKNFVKSHCP